MNRQATYLTLAAIGVGVVFLVVPLISWFGTVDSAQSLLQLSASGEAEVREQDANVLATGSALAPERLATSELFEGNAALAQVQLRNSHFSKNFEFSDGESVSVSYVSPAQESTDIGGLDDGTSGGFYERLSAAAKDGNSAAALQLYYSLKDCANKPTTVAELETVISQIRDGAIPPPANSGVPLTEAVDSLTKSYKRCKGVTSDMQETAVHLLQDLADSGDVASALLFAKEQLKSQPETSEEYFRQAWTAGSAGGAAGLSAIYKARAATSGNYEDAVRAFAYFYVSSAIELARYDGLPGEVIARHKGRILERMEAEEASTQLSVIPVAVDRAKQLIKANKNCCLTM